MPPNRLDVRCDATLLSMRYAPYRPAAIRRRPHMSSTLGGAASMGGDQNGGARLSRLPREPIDRVANPLARFLRIETASGLVLLLAAIAALVLSNSPWADGFHAIWEAP